MELKEFIYKRRKELGMTQNDLAKVIGKPKNYISRLESGIIKDTKRDTTIKLAQALKCPASVFFNGFDENGKMISPHLELVTENVEPMTKEEIENHIALDKVLEEKGFVVLSAEDFYNEVIEMMGKTEDLTEEKKTYIKQSLGFACDIKEDK